MARANGAGPGPDLNPIDVYVAIIGSEAGGIHPAIQLKDAGASVSIVRRKIRLAANPDWTQPTSVSPSADSLHLSCCSQLIAMILLGLSGVYFGLLVWIGLDRGDDLGDASWGGIGNEGIVVMLEASLDLVLYSPQRFLVRRRRVGRQGVRQSEADGDEPISHKQETVGEGVPMINSLFREPVERVSEQLVKAGVGLLVEWHAIERDALDMFQ